MNKPILTETPPGAPATGATQQAPGFPEILERMTPAERLRAYRAGAFDRDERTIWAGRFPEEAPLVNGELEWIALTLADLD